MASTRRGVDRLRRRGLEHRRGVDRLRRRGLEHRRGVDRLRRRGLEHVVVRQAASSWPRTPSWCRQAASSWLEHRRGVARGGGRWNRRARRHRAGSGYRIHQRRAVAAGVLRLAPGAGVAVDLVGGSGVGAAIQLVAGVQVAGVARLGEGVELGVAAERFGRDRLTARRPGRFESAEPAGAAGLSPRAGVAVLLVRRVDRRLQEEVVAGDEVAVEARLGEGVEGGVGAEVSRAAWLPPVRPGSELAGEAPTFGTRASPAGVAGSEDAWATAPHTASESAARTTAIAPVRRDGRVAPTTRSSPAVARRPLIGSGFLSVVRPPTGQRRRY